MRRRPSTWLMLVVLLAGLLLLREPRFAAVEEVFLGWLLKHSQGAVLPVPLAVIEIGRDPLLAPAGAPGAGDKAPPSAGDGAVVSPLEFALFLQSVHDFQPGVVAFENILRWRERDKAQEQVFLDQAMRVPKLLLAAELGAHTDPDAPWAEIRSFTQVSGKRGDLAAFSGVERQPNEDLRLISALGYTNLPGEISSRMRMPLLFLYRGEVVPSFSLQAILLWLRITPAEVKIALGSHIELGQGRRIPIGTDGTLLINPNASRRVRRLSLNELLLAAQQRDAGVQAGADLRDHVVLARTPSYPLAPPDRFAATIATLQGDRYLRRITPLFDFAILLFLGAMTGVFRTTEPGELLLWGTAFTAAYCLLALGALARWELWIPGVLTLSATWILILLGVVLRRKEPS